MAYWKDDKRLKKINNREGPDLLVKWIRIASLLCWFFFFMTVLIWDSARPQLYSIIDQHYGKISRTGWATSLINLAFIFALFTFIFTTISLMFNSRRLKRTHDHISTSLVICMCATGLIIIAFMLYYVGII